MAVKLRRGTSQSLGTASQSSGTARLCNPSRREPGPARGLELFRGACLTSPRFVSRAWIGSRLGTLSRGLFDFAMLCIASLDWLVGWNACARNFADRFASLRARVTLYNRELEGSRYRGLEGSRHRELQGSRNRERQGSRSVYVFCSRLSLNFSVLGRCRALLCFPVNV